MTTSRPKRHHFVPQMLLRFFASPGEEQKIWQLRVDDDSEPIQTAIVNAAVVTNYYTHFRDRPRKEDDLFWEELFGEWEERAATALREFEDDPDQLHSSAQALLFLQLLRTPLGQAQMARQAEAERRRIFGAPGDSGWTRWVLERTGQIPGPEEWTYMRGAAEATHDVGAHQQSGSLDPDANRGSYQAPGRNPGDDGIAGDRPHTPTDLACGWYGKCQTRRPSAVAEGERATSAARSRGRRCSLRGIARRCGLVPAERDG